MNGNSIRVNSLIGEKEYLKKVNHKEFYEQVKRDVVNGKRHKSELKFWENTLKIKRKR